MRRRPKSRKRKMGNIAVGYWRLVINGRDEAIRYAMVGSHDRYIRSIKSQNCMLTDKAHKSEINLLIFPHPCSSSTYSLSRPHVLARVLGRC